MRYNAAMKTYTGSLQRRGRRYYLVIHQNGRQRWFALKTDKLPLARMRAAKLAPADPDEETAWLEQLVREGERARVLLSRRRAQRELTWENLGSYWAVPEDDRSGDNRRSHRRWLQLLAEAAANIHPSVSPGALCPEATGRIVTLLSETYLSARRMISFYRRVWKSLGLNPGVWSSPDGPRERSCRKVEEHYRRLSLEEVRRVYEGLSACQPELADMVLIGYSTGLRLSDVAELELSEVALSFLKVCPNKTRRTKPRTLRIPLTEEAQRAVLRLKLAAERSDERFLFSRGTRHRPSRRLTAAFAAAGVIKAGTGRASFHSLRATFISLMDDAGIPPHLTDSITGHIGGGMHARYTQPSDEALLAAVAKAMPPIEPLRGSSEL